jgi:apolipoprotein N-acyltransferase
MSKRFIGLTVILAWLCWPAAARATQTHGGPEGLFVHQFAHLFFAFSMGLLIYWLRKRGLVFNRSWRYIQYAAVFLIAWNLDALCSHWLLEQSGFIAVENIRGMHIRITTRQGLHWLAQIYYLSKLDHLLCVPAMSFLLLGLRRLYKSSLPGQERGEPAS